MTTRGSPFRALIFLVLAAAVGLFVGAQIIKSKTLDRVRQRAYSDSSSVLAAAIPVGTGSNIHSIVLLKRLKRLGYQKLKKKPTHPGQYSLTNNALSIFLRKVALSNGQIQEEQLVTLNLDSKGNVLELVDQKFDARLSHIWLEPELIGLLGTSSTRVNSQKTLADFPELLVESVLAVEDSRFYSHPGIDPLGIARALWANLRAGGVIQGGSTITQQLAKNLFFSHVRSIKRKILEACTSILMELAFSKDEILELYLNEVFLAQEGNAAIHGFEQASLSLFGKELSALSSAEIATLVGLIKAPSRYSPRRHPKRATQRRNLVLKQMTEAELISEQELESARQEKLSVQAATRNQRTAPYFLDFVRRTFPELDPGSDSESGINVYSSVDLELQHCAEKAVQESIKKLEQSYPSTKRKSQPLQGAIVAAEVNSGRILAWVGGRDYSQNQFDRVSQAVRQPGSTFKPVVYLTALERNLNSYRVARTTSILEDRPVSFRVPGSDIWSPQNYNKKFREEVTVREALAYSLNVPTVNLALKVGLENIVRTAKLLGFQGELPAVPSLALGAGEVSPLQLTQVFITLANGGKRVQLQPILAIRQNDEPEALYESYLEEEEIASEGATFVLTNMLQSAIDRGTGRVVRRMGFTHPAAGKTGTSSDTRDAWFVGYTPKLLATVWVGYDDNQKVGLTGSQAAAPIWTRFMKCALKQHEPTQFVTPQDVVYREIDNETGLLWTRDCPRRQKLTEVFVRGTEPITPCYRHSRQLPERYQRPQQRRNRRPNRWQRVPHNNKDWVNKLWGDLLGR